MLDLETKISNFEINSKVKKLNNDNYKKIYILTEYIHKIVHF